MKTKNKVLNLYAGVGGNRKLWKNCQVTAIENNEEIANEYKKNFPNDEVIITDAHEYLLNNYDKFDFIWSSPPCQTHSTIRTLGVFGRKQYNPKYPDMSLYQEIILLQKFSRAKWVVENVIPYYEPLIPGKIIERHMFWSNFKIPNFETYSNRKHMKINPLDCIYGFKLSKNIKNKRQVLRNLVNPELGLHIYNTAMKLKPVKTLQTNLFEI